MNTGSMDGDKLTHWTAMAAVLAVAAVAAVISYRHAVDVVTAHGETGMISRLYPVVIDGLIVAASMVLLDAARHREPAPVLAWCMLSAGIAATLAANMLAGITAGPLGAVVAAWPALAFAGCYELMMMLVRTAAARALTQPPAPTDADIPNAQWAPVPADAETAALAALRATTTAGNPLSGRQLEARFGLTRAQATKVRAAVLTEANGHHAREADELIPA